MSEHFLQWPQFCYVTALPTPRHSFLATLIAEGPKIRLDLGATPVLLFLQTSMSIGKLRVLHPQLCFANFTSLPGREPC